MQILVVTTWFPSVQKPTEAPFNLEHVKAIRAFHEVRVVHLRLGSSEAAAVDHYEGIEVLRLPLNPKHPVQVIGSLRALAREADAADVVHTMAFSSILPISLLLPFKRRPWIHTEHWNGVTNPQSVGGLWPKFAGLRKLLRLPNRVTGVTTQLAEKLAEFSKPGAVSVVPCVVPNSRPIVPLPAGPSLRLLAVGGLIARKRPLLAVRTVHWLRQQGHDVRLDWAGDGEQRAEVEQLITDLELQNAVRLLGSVAPEQIFALFDEVHLFFLPTEQENFFTSAAEAMSSGRAVVAPHVGGYDDYATAENSILVADVAVETLGAAILDAYERFRDVEPRQIAEPIRLRFSAKRVGGLFDQLYREITSKTPEERE